MSNSKTKPSIAAFIIILSLATKASANEPTSIVKREDADSPYIIESYPCDLSKLKRREDGSTFGRVKTSPSSIALAVTPETYEAVLTTGSRTFLSYMENNPEIKHMRSKIKQFEDEGNIPAMKHWDNKLRTEFLYKETYFRRTAILQYISKQTTKEKLPTYYTANDGIKIYSTFEEMDDDYQNYCNFGLKR